MDEKTALHTAARRYCQDRFSYWARVYEELQAKESGRVQEKLEPGWDYSEQEYRTFPRYRIAQAIQVEVERLTVDSGTGLDELKIRLTSACDVAEARLHVELKNSIARKALREEAEDYKDYVQVLRANDLGDVEALPFRRVINEFESKRLWNRLREIWGIDGQYWFPIKQGPIPPNVVAFHTDYFQKMHGVALLREALRTRGVARVFQLHESGEPHYEIELGDLEPGYRDGGERYSTSWQTDWVVYASHESSIAISGDWLIQVFRETWPGCHERTYNGPFSTPDLRGTWDTR